MEPINDRPKICLFQRCPLDHIGKVAYYNGGIDLYHGMNLLLIRADSYTNTLFLHYWLNSKSTRKTTRNLARQAVSQASINTSDLRDVKFFAPHLPEQTAIAEILSEMDAELDALAGKLSKARQIKQGMMQELLTGKTRLV